MIFKKIKKNILNKGMKAQDFCPESYSQEGEDIILSKIFEGKKSGFYVDIGAHHPFRFSNTYIFYKKGWNGINIDPLPEFKELFDKYRPKDINLNFAVSDTSDKLTYYMFNEPALNTFSINEAKSKDGIHNGMYKIINTQDIQMVTLESILDSHLENNEIDFINIDVEGLDLNVLKSNNWEKYKPKIILIEELNFDFLKLYENQVFVYLSKKGYLLKHRTFNTSFYCLT
jgi:FkbM family methyltransferase